MKQRDSLFCSQIRVFVGKHELDRRKEVRLSRAISADDDVVLRTEKMIKNLQFYKIPENVASRVAIRSESLNPNFFDVHFLNFNHNSLKKNSLMILERIVYMNCENENISKDSSMKDREVERASSVQNGQNPKKKQFVIKKN